MPRDFDVRILDRPEGLEFWTPLKNETAGYAAGGMGPVAIVGRLRDGLSIAAAQSEVARITRTTESVYRMNFNQFVVNLTSLQADNSPPNPSNPPNHPTSRGRLAPNRGEKNRWPDPGPGNGGRLKAAAPRALGPGRPRRVRRSPPKSLLVPVIGEVPGAPPPSSPTKRSAPGNPPGTLPAKAAQTALPPRPIGGVASLTPTATSEAVPACRAPSADPQNPLNSGAKRGPPPPTRQRQPGIPAGQMATPAAVLIIAAPLSPPMIRLLADPPRGDYSKLPRRPSTSRPIPPTMLTSGATTTTASSTTSGRPSQELRSPPAAPRRRTTGPPSPPRMVRRSPPSPRIGSADRTSPRRSARRVPLRSGRVSYSIDVTTSRLVSSRTPRPRDDTTPDRTPPRPNANACAAAAGPRARESAATAAPRPRSPTRCSPRPISIDPPPRPSPSATIPIQRG